MKSIFNFIIKPKKGKRYNNTKKIGDVDLILNSDNYQHKFVNREAEVIDTPVIEKTEIKKGDTVLVHHNVFRRWKDMKGVEKNSKAYYKDDMYFVFPDQIFAYKRKDKWTSLDGYCFVKPIKPYSKHSVDNEEPLMGIVKYTDGTIDENSLIGFKPSSEYEFILNNERLYRVKSKFITIKYEYKGNEKEYNPSWAQSC